ncbi:glycosyltransferase family 2 protein [Microlunatus ginsengisoli]|uniref:4,4'-diaponeurosporenoate glycosyltransferase n=1 Tax=Microlunatus ginsengisoli TaxID=363863 RepID=A0ABP7AJQ2_9ACTN
MRDERADQTLDHPSETPGRGPENTAGSGLQQWDLPAPRFSVVIPALNEAALLPATLHSLRGQRSASPFEIIVVDNNSTDATAQIARSFGVRVITETNPGVCQARQAGTLAARGEIVVSADADTVYPPDWLSRLDATFTAQPDAVAVAGPCRYADPPWWMRVFCRGLFAAVGRVYQATGRVGYATATNLAFRRFGFDGYDLNLTQGGDELDLLRRLRRHGTVLWDPSNTVTTSSRRQQRGLLYTLLVTLAVYYLLGYWLNRIFRRPVLGMAPPIRGLETETAQLPANDAAANLSAEKLARTEAAENEAGRNEMSPSVCLQVAGKTGGGELTPPAAGAARSVDSSIGASGGRRRSG